MAPKIILALFIAIRVTRPVMISETTQSCDFKCSMVNDPVCGMTKDSGGTLTMRKYQNLCTLLKIKCMTANSALELKVVPDTLCGIKKEKISRRVADFSIVGAHQSCNHTCPTYCIDTYEPACAQIYYPGFSGSYLKPMINHCHVDLFSCAAKLNVTIHPLYKCAKNPNVLMFMSQMAALKSLHLLEDHHTRRRR